MNDIKVMEFKEAIMEVSLNSFLYPEVVELETSIRAVSDLLMSVEERSERMPERELDLKENMVKRFETEVNALVRFVTKAKTVADNEMKRRRGVEKRSVQAKEMADVRARQTATAAKNKLEKDEKNRKDALNALDGKQKEKTSGTRMRASIAKEERASRMNVVHISITPSSFN
tara:strand:- start:31 stop:549 length:519 start_codon:yes stop_codon:yes gene_type:complete